MKVILNGADIEVKKGLSLKVFLEKLDISLKGIAVERNGEIVPKSTYGKTLLVKDDYIEIVRMVGGG